MRKDGTMVGSEMLRLAVGMVRDGTASDGIVTDGSARDGSARDGIATDSIPTEGKTCDGTWNPEAVPSTPGEAIPKEAKLDPGTLSTLFVGIPKIGSPVGVAGKLIIGRPKESTIGAAVGSPSMLGGGMEKGGGLVIIGKVVESEGSGAKDGEGGVAEGMLALFGRAVLGRLMEKDVADGISCEGRVVEMGGVVGRVAEERGIVGSVSEGVLIEGTLGDGSVNDGKPIEPRLPDRILDSAIVREGRPIVGRLADGILGAGMETEGTPMEPRLPDERLGAGIVTEGIPIEPRLPDGRLGAGIVYDGRLADSRPIEPALAEGAFSEDKNWPRGSTVVNVVEGRMTVTSVLGGKLTERRLPDGTLSEGRVTEGALTVGNVADGRPLIESRLTDGIPIEAKGIPIALPLMDGIPSEAIEMEDRLIGPIVGTGTPTYSTLIDTISGSPVGAVGPLLSPAKIVGADAVCPAGTLMGVEVLMGIGIEAIRIGLAAMSRGERRRGRRMVEGGMVWVVERVFLGGVEMGDDGMGRWGGRGEGDKWTVGSAVTFRRAEGETLEQLRM